MRCVRMAPSDFTLSATLSAAVVRGEWGKGESARHARKSEDESGSGGEGRHDKRQERQ